MEKFEPALDPDLFEDEDLELDEDDFDDHSLDDDDLEDWEDS